MRTIFFIHCQICQPESMDRNTFILHCLLIGFLQSSFVNALELLPGLIPRLNLIISVNKCNYIKYISLVSTLRDALITDRKRRLFSEASVCLQGEGYLWSHVLSGGLGISGPTSLPGGRISWGYRICGLRCPRMQGIQG